MLKSSIFLAIFVFSHVTRAQVQAQTERCDGGGSYPVHLTFDDGPKMPETKIILDELRKRNVKATFLISTSRLRFLLQDRRPSEGQAQILDLIERMKREGHVIGSHSMDHVEHANPETVPAAVAARNISESREVLRKLRVPPPIPFRFPFGSGWFQERNPAKQGQADAMMKKVRELGFTPYHWDIDTWDWSAIKRKALPKSVLRQICSHRGGTVLMHDIQSFTAQNLPAILDSITGSGHRLVSFPEIKSYSETLNVPLPAFRDRAAGVFFCQRPVGDLDMVWGSCEEYSDKSSDMRRGTR